MSRILAIARALLGGWLSLLAAVVLFYPPAVEAYARTGCPTWSRWLLGGMEMIGGALFMFLRTVTLGTILLFGSLTMAIGLHLGLARNLGGLPFFAGGVIALHFASGKVDLGAAACKRL